MPMQRCSRTPQNKVTLPTHIHTYTHTHTLTHSPPHTTTNTTTHPTRIPSYTHTHTLTHSHSHTLTHTHTHTHTYAGRGIMRLCKAGRMALGVSSGSHKRGQERESTCLNTTHTWLA